MTEAAEVLVVDKPMIAGSSWPGGRLAEVLVGRLVEGEAALTRMAPAAVVLHGLQGARGLEALRRFRQLTDAPLVVFLGRFTRAEAVSYVLAGAAYCGAVPGDARAAEAVVTAVVTAARARAHGGTASPPGGPSIH